jgi:multiple sugar transport system permease protein
MPFILGVLIFWFGPMLYSMYLVVNEWSMLTPPTFVGLDNFRRLFEDPLIATSLGNTAYYTFLGVPLQLIIAFALAMALNQKIQGQAIYRTVFYLPSIVPAVANAVVWTQILNPDYGVINNILQYFGLQKVNWLFDPAAAKPAFILMSLWTTGSQMVIFLAGLQGVPQQLLEAAQIDGAGIWSRFWNVTVPMISPTILFNLVMGIIGSFQVFTGSFIMTRGGPQNATLFMVLYVYEQGFQLYRMGYAATIAWLLFGIIMIFTFVQFRLANRWVYYEVSD